MREKEKKELKRATLSELEKEGERKGGRGEGGKGERKAQKNHLIKNFRKESNSLILIAMIKHNKGVPFAAGVSFDAQEGVNELRGNGE